MGSLVTTITTTVPRSVAWATRVTRTSLARLATPSASEATPSATMRVTTPSVTTTRRITAMVAGPTTSAPGTTVLTAITSVTNSSRPAAISTTMPAIPLTSKRTDVSDVVTATLRSSTRRTTVRTSTPTPALRSPTVSPVPATPSTFSLAVVIFVKLATVLTLLTGTKKISMMPSVVTAPFTATPSVDTAGPTA